MPNNDPESNDNDPASELVGERVRIYQRGETWYANYQHEGRQFRPSLQTRNKKLALRKAIRLEAELQNGHLSSSGKIPALTEVVSKYMQYLKSEGRADKTLGKYENVFRRLQDLAAVRRVTKISGVTPDLLDAYKQQRIDVAAKKTIHTEAVVIRQLVNYALSRKLITTDPLQGVKLQKPKPRPQPCWSWQEVEQILAAAREPHRSVLTLLAETGARVGEVKHLTWPDIDFDRRVLLIREKEGWKPKTGDARAVPLTPKALAVLRELPRKNNSVFTAAPSEKYPRGDHPISERRLLEHLKRVLKRLGLKGHIHTLRHAFVSNALMQGTPEAVVRQWVGHVDGDILKLYTHILDEASQRAMRQLAEKNNQIAQNKEVHDAS